MKICAECRAENPADATVCRECGCETFAPPPDAPISIPSSPPPIEGDWVTVRRCANLPSADAVAMELRAAEIPVFMPHEFASQTLPIWPHVDVKVPADQLQRAREILDSPDSAAPQTVE
jgi:hypothetical protein